MAVKKESLIALLIKTGIAADEAKAKEIVDAEAEQEISIPDTTKVFVGEAFTKATENIKNDGIKIGKELSIKDLKEKAGLEFEGKSPDKFIEEFKAHVSKEAGTSVDEKVKSRDKTISEMKAALEAVTKERDEVKTSMTQKQKDLGIMKHFPKNRDDRFSDDMYLNSLKGELEFTEEEGKPVVKKNGEVLKDDQFNPISYEAAISGHFSAAKWVKSDDGGGDPPGGRGGGNKGGGAPGTFLKMSEFTKHLESQGIHPGSQKASQLLQEAIKANPQMDVAT